jgi:hypothetical protein
VERELAGGGRGKEWVLEVKKMEVYFIYIRVCVCMCVCVCVCVKVA